MYMRVLIFITMIAIATLPIVAAEEKPVVVCTTSVLASIVKDLAGDKVVVEVIASPSVCPAHYDIKPSDVEKVRMASLILYHGFEPWIKDLVKASGSKAPLVAIKGSWNTPDLLKKKYEEVAKALEKYLGIDVSEKLRRCLKAIDETSQWLKKFAEEHGFTNTPVIVMLWQKNFVSFLGFKIVGVFGPPEKVSLKQFEELVKNGTKYGAVLVIDNLQSGVELGKKLAKEIGAIEVALTNFPYTAPELVNMTEVMKYNARLLAQALQYARWRSSSAEVGQLYEEINSLRAELSLWRYAFIASAVINVALLVCVVALVAKLRRR